MYWCLLFVLIRQGLRGGSGPQRLIRALGIETGNPIMTFEQRSSFLPSTERAPHHTSTGIPYGRCSFASTLSLSLPNPLALFFFGGLLAGPAHRTGVVIYLLFIGMIIEVIRSVYIMMIGRFIGCVCVCLLLVRAKAKIKGNKYGATRSAGDYRRHV